jgi:hypothetical protein
MTIQEILADVRTLEGALAALSASRPPWKVADIVAMDEYTHDVVVESKGRWAVIDAT